MDSVIYKADKIGGSPLPMVNRLQGPPTKTTLDRTWMKYTETHSPYLLRNNSPLTITMAYRPPKFNATFTKAFQ